MVPRIDGLRGFDDRLQSHRLGDRTCLGENSRARLRQTLTTEATMDKFLVLYKAPNAVIDEWMKKPEQERKPDETKMMDAWKKWMSANASKFTHKGAGVAKPMTGH